MNFLAHFHLAQATEASRVGAVLGDFVKGTPESLRKRFPDEVVEGVRLHRAIDQFTDSHSVFLKTRDFLAPSRRRFAGIIVDIFFDHFLTKHWAKYSSDHLPDFISEIHRTLNMRKDWLTPELREVVKRMGRENWLGTYGTIPGLDLTFRRVSTRRDFLAPLRGAVADLESNFGEFEKAFLKFYPELESFARSWGKNPGGAESSR